MDHIMIWSFQNAPEAFRMLSDFDNDWTGTWVAFLPTLYRDVWNGREFWKGGWFGEEIHHFELGKYGGVILIGANHTPVVAYA